jgi:hypothetical protein
VVKYQIYWSDTGLVNDAVLAFAMWHLEENQSDQRVSASQGCIEHRTNPLKTKLVYMLFKNPVRTSKRTQHFTITKSTS